MTQAWGGGAACGRLFIESLTEPSSILDIGGAHGPEVAAFQEAGHDVRLWDVAKGDGLYGPNDLGEFDAVYCSHTLEHMRSPGMALEAMAANTRMGGLIGITVPPMKDQIVSGHVTLWNAGLLLYQMILAGLDCSDAAVQSAGYDCSVLVRKRPATLPKLSFFRGDIELLAPFFPMRVGPSFDGRIGELNWSPR